MKVTFLGTSGAVPTTDRNTSALLVAREGDRLLFDCGEGTQRQMMHFGTGFDVGHIFLSHVHGDHILGLPGLVQTWDFNGRERPLAVHAPSGTRRTVETLLGVTGNEPEYPVRVNQVADGDTVLSRDEYDVRAFAVDHRTRAVGYALVESERKGRFDRERAEEEFGIPPGPKYSKLHDGESVEHDGETIDPDDLVGPPRPGRRVVYTGDTRPSDRTVEMAAEADLLVHDGCFADEHSERAAETGHSTAREAARIAKEAEARQLALTHVSTRYAGQYDRLTAEAREVFPNTLTASDGLIATIPYPDSQKDFQTERP